MIQLLVAWIWKFGWCKKETVTLSCPGGLKLLVNAHKCQHVSVTMDTDEVSNLALVFLAALLSLKQQQPPLASRVIATKATATPARRWQPHSKSLCIFMSYAAYVIAT